MFTFLSGNYKKTEFFIKSKSIKNNFLYLYSKNINWIFVHEDG